MNKKVALSELAPIIEEKLGQGGSVTIEITGQSMLPLLVEGRDSVEIVRCADKLRKYDLPLYRRRDGSFVLHRVIGVRRGGYVMCGDNQYTKEYPITDEQIIGVVTSVCRDGKNINVNDRLYKKYVKRRVALRGFRYAKSRFSAIRRVLFGEK